MRQDEILLAVANYNQAQEIRSFLETLVQYWPKNHIAVIDDGSTDGSADIPQSLGIQALRHSHNRGIGAAIRTGILHAKNNGYKGVLIMSSNGKMVPAEISRVVNPILDGTADYVTGSRFMSGGDFPGMTLFRRLSIPVFSMISVLTLGRYFTDVTCGFRCYKIDFLFDGGLDIEQEWLDRYELEYYIHYFACAKKLRIKEVPVTIRYNHLEKDRHSKIKPIVGWWSMIRPFIYLRLGIKK